MLSLRVLPFLSSIEHYRAVKLPCLHEAAAEGGVAPLWVGGMPAANAMP